jgi:hypothetical protein
MTCGFDMYVSMFWVKLDDLLVGYFGIIKKKIKIIDNSLINFLLSNWTSYLIKH